MPVNVVSSTKPKRDGCEIRAEVPATLDALERLLEDFRDQSKSTLRNPKCFVAELLLREALTNAVVHGSHRDPARVVRCAIRMNAKRLIIAIEDQGAGFDWRATRGREAGATDCSGRGMEILRKFASHVRFNRRGNAVAIKKVFLMKGSCDEVPDGETEQ